MTPEQRNIAKRLGSVLRAMREETGLSQIDFAEKADLAHNHVGQVERGELNITVYVLIKAARTFGLSAGELLKKAGI